MTAKPNTDPNKLDLSRHRPSFRMKWQVPPMLTWQRRHLLKQL